MAVNDHAVLQSLLIVLATAVAIVSLAPRIKISPVVGYLFAGALLGPHATGVIREPESLGFLAELGVALLLFGIGLELSLPKIFALKRWVFGLGAIQVLVTTGGLTGAIMLAGLNWEAALAIGSALSLSSTALVLQLLGERKEYATAFAPVVFAVLLFQDLAVLPLLTIVPGLASPPDVMLGRLAIDLGWAFAALALSLLLGQKLLQPLFRFVARSSHRDILVGTALLAILGAAYGVSLFGLSLALGALLAGLLLSSSEFRHEVEADVRPFKGVLLGFFFMHVGMTADLVSIRDNWLWVTLGGIGLLLIKAGILFCLCLAMRLPRDQAPRVAAYLSQGSEFSFVLLATAVGAGVVLAHDAALALASVLFTMILTPLVVAQAKQLSRQRPGPLQSLPTMPEMAGKALIIAGFGRVGHSVARMAAASGRPYLAVDFDSARVAEGRANAFPVFFGDASRLDILQQLGIENAEACVVTLDDPLLAQNLVAGLRRRYPQLAIYARARDLAHAQKLKNAGASVAVPEAVEGSLQLGARVLEGLGEGPNVVEALIAELREEGYRGL